MKAILVNEDRSLRWDDVPNPIVKDEDVLIKIEAAALNRADLMQREGDYPPPEGCPEWMGLEVAGEIIEMGCVAKEKSNFKIGDKVCSLLGGGGYAEFVNVKYDMIMPVPKNCSMIEAAAIPEAFATAYLNLFIEGNIKEGDTLLMNAGASGLASVIIPMANSEDSLFVDYYVDMAKRYGYTVFVFRCMGEFTNIHSVPYETLKNMSDGFEDYEGEIFVRPCDNNYMFSYTPFTVDTKTEM